MKTVWNIMLTVAGVLAALGIALMLAGFSLTGFNPKQAARELSAAQEPVADLAAEHRLYLFGRTPFNYEASGGTFYHVGPFAIFRAEE